MGSINVFVGLLIIAGLFALGFLVWAAGYMIFHAWKAHHYTLLSAGALGVFIILSYIFGGESCREP